jgi:hypothetical protein
MSVRLIVTIGLLCASVAGAGAQVCPLSVEATSIPVQQLTLADVDLENFRSSGLLFTIRIPNSGAETVNARLDAVLSIDLTDGRTYPTAVSMRTEPFPIPPGGRSITNLDMGDQADIKFEFFEYDNEAQDAIEDATLASGIFPAGVYRITFALIDCPSADPVWVEFDLRNPSRIILVSPREGEVTSQFPMFEFFHEATDARITVTELLPGQSYEAAITRVPQMNRVDIGAARSYLYNAGRPLETGKSYVWNIETFTRASGGREVAEASPIQMFTVGKAEGPYDALLARLEVIYGQQYPDLFAALKQGRYGATGTFTLDGETLSEQDLLEILIRLQDSADDDELTLE